MHTRGRAINFPKIFLGETVRSVNLWDGRRVSIFGNVKRVNNFPKNFGIIIFQEFSETNYFPKIFQEFSKKFRGLKKLVEIIFLFLLKIKRRKLIRILIRITYTYIYTYNLYVYKPKKTVKGVRVSVLTRGAVPAAQERTAERIRTTATASIHIYKRWLQRNSVTRSNQRRSCAVYIRRSYTYIYTYIGTVECAVNV